MQGSHDFSRVLSNFIYFSPRKHLPVRGGLYRCRAYSGFPKHTATAVRKVYLTVRKICVSLRWLYVKPGCELPVALPLLLQNRKKPAYADSFDSVHNPINWDFRFLLIFCRLHHMQDMDLLSPGLSLPLDKIRCLSGFLWQEFLCRM